MFTFSNLYLKISSILLLCISFVLFLSLSIVSLQSINYSINLFGGIIISCIGSYLFIKSNNFDNPRSSYIVLILLGLGIRLAVAIQPKATIDMSTWGIMADAVLNQGNLYESGRIVWPPYWPWFLGMLKYSSNYINLPFYFLVRLSLIINDLLLILFLNKILMLKGLRRVYNLRILALYFLNPLVVIITVYHPQFGSIVFTFLLAAYYFGQIGRNNIHSTLLAFGTAIKHISGPALISFFIYSKSKEYWLIMPLLLITFFFLPILPYYLDNPESIQNSVFNYTSRAGYFGIWSTLADFQSEYFQSIMRFKILFVLITFVGCLGIVIFARKKGKSLIEAIQLSFLTFHILTPGWAIQYQFWLIPFGVLCFNTKTQLILFSIIGSLAYSEYFYGDWPVNPQIFLPFQYGIIIWWLLSILFPKSLEKELL